MTDMELADRFKNYGIYFYRGMDDAKPTMFTNEECQQIIAALRRGHEPEREFSPFWLIERGQAVHHEPTIWWKGGDVRTWPSAGEDWKGKDWTENAPEARRFRTHEEALQLAKILFGDRSHLPPSFSITEHSLVGKSEHPPSGEMVMVSLEEAAKSMCGWCRKGSPVHYRKGFGWWHSDFAVGTVTCSSHQIRMLSAAEAEGSSK